MGLDIGDARIGVALSDPLGLTAQPFATVDQIGKRSIQRILEIVTEMQVTKLVVGLPLELDGTAGPQAEKSRDFGEKLRAAAERKFGRNKVEVVYWDERLSTVAAERALAGSGLKGLAGREALDRVAAAVILDGFLRSLSVEPR